MTISTSLNNVAFTNSNPTRNILGNLRKIIPLGDTRGKDLIAGIAGSLEVNNKPLDEVLCLFAIKYDIDSSRFDRFLSKAERFIKRAASMIKVLYYKHDETKTVSNIAKTIVLYPTNCNLMINIRDYLNYYMDNLAFSNLKEIFHETRLVREIYAKVDDFLGDISIENKIAILFKEYYSAYKQESQRNPSVNTKNIKKRIFGQLERSQPINIEPESKNSLFDHSLENAENFLCGDKNQNKYDQVDPCIIKKVKINSYSSENYYIKGSAPISIQGVKHNKVETKTNCL